MKVLIVEDELAIIEMIKRITPWENLGVTEVLTAENGDSAYRIVTEKEPDIVISDIEMPVMDGITMAERIYNTIDDPPVIIFLTCHAEFHYAQRAIRCGVSDYLLKPFMPEELTAVLSKAIVRCREKTVVEAKTDNKAYIQQGLMRDVLNHVYDDNAIRLRWAATKYDVKLNDGNKYMVAVGIPIDEALKQYSKSELIFMFGNICREIFYGLDSEQEGLLVDYTIHNFYRGYLFLNENQKSSIEEKCNRLITALRHYFEFSATCIISDLLSITDYANTKDRMESYFNRIVNETSSVVYLEKVEKVESNGTRINKSLVLQYIRERKKSDLLLYMRHLMENSLGNQEMKQVFYDVQQVFYGYLFENRIDTSEFMQDDVGKKISEMAQFSSLNMIKYVSYLYDSVFRHIEDLKKSQSVIERAKKFVAEHYMENIGRTEIAQEVMLAPNYLSMLFHKETGQTIREYINYCRVEEAKKIMMITNNSITDVAMVVGFDNISYFSTVFKKYTGISPAEYRHNLEGKE